MKWNSFIKLSEMHVNIFIHLILSEQIRFELQYSHIDKNLICTQRREAGECFGLAYSVNFCRWTFKQKPN